MRRCAAALILAGCGRVAFDPVGDAAGPAADAACSWGPWGAPQRIAELAGAGREEGPWMSADGLEVVFASDRGGQFDLYRAERATRGGTFGTPERLPGPPTPEANDPYVTPDGTRLYVGGVNLATTTTRIYTATRTGRGDPFTGYQLVGDLSAGGANPAAPSLSADGATMLFVNSGGTDELFAATRIGTTEQFGGVRHLGVLDTAAGECCLAFGPDGGVLFNRTEAEVMVVYAPSLDAPAARFTPISTGTPGDEDGDPYFTTDGSTIIFVSLRAGSEQTDIYTIERSCQ